jgi:hypothetical protein
MSLRTVEAAFHIEIELGSSEIVLLSHSRASLTNFPSSFPFAIPLSVDTPQSVETPHSSLSHYLTATLHPMEPLLPSLSKTLLVHTRRYSGHSHTIPLCPELHSLDDPTRVEVEVPRTTFKASESIPVYVTVPPPMRELVVDHGLRLRNVRAELVRLVEVKQGVGGDDIPESEAGIYHTQDGTLEGQSSVTEDSIRQEASTSSDKSSSSKSPVSPIFFGPSFRAVVARSGASCRFHSSRPVRLRFILHQPISSGSPSDFTVNLPSGEYGQLDSDAECASITQLTLLHSITFQLNIYISFVDMSTRRERISIISIPIAIIPAPTPLPEVSQAIDAAYQKKHDQPPTKTVRQDDVDHLVPHYSEGEAGPSMLPTTAPPPFEEQDAPPPFFFSEAEASTSTRLPTFLESESEIIIPDEVPHHMLHSPSSPSIAGEGLDFGFLSSQQFDGHSEDMQRSSTPPPTLEMATRDTDLTSLSELHEPERMMETVGLALEQHKEDARGELPPPPPPAMDDPFDPPPSIDSDFRSPEATRPAPHPSPPLHPSYTLNDPPRLHTPSPIPTSGEPRLTHAGHAPPPYLVPGNLGDQEHVTRPPPYMD